MRAFVATATAVLVATLVGVGAIWLSRSPTPSAAGQRQQAERALERDERSAFSAANSPLLDASGVLTDVVAIEATPSSRPRLTVEAWLNGAWRLVQTIRLPRRDHLAMRAAHTPPGRVAPPVWFTAFDLSPGEPGVALYDMDASGWHGLVIAELGGDWGIVPFARYGRRELPYPYFVSPSIVTTATDSCHPNCASGKWTARSFRFNAQSDSFQTSGAPSAAPPRAPGKA